MSDIHAGAPMTGGRAARPAATTSAVIWDTVTYWFVLFGIYFTVGAVFLSAGAEKLFTTHPGAPDAVVKQFSATFIAPIVSPLWVVLGILEIAVFLVLLASLVTGEFLPSHQKSLLATSLGLALVTFACLSFGQTLANNFTGAAEQWAYFGGTAVMMLLLAILPPNRPRDWISGEGAAHQ